MGRNSSRWLQSLRTISSSSNTASGSIVVYEENQRHVGVQVGATSEDAETQVGDAFVKSTMYRMFHTSKSVPSAVMIEVGTPLKDPLVIALGEFGRWQLMVQLVLLIFNIPYVFHLVVAEFESNLFGGHWCARPKNLENISVEVWKEISGVSHQKEDPKFYDPCFKKNLNYDELNPNDKSTWEEKGAAIPCTSWEFENNYSLVSEWNLVCAWPSVTTIAESSLAVGGFIGSTLSGYLVDRNGRRAFLVYCLGASTFVNFMTALAPWYWFYITFRGIQGFLLTGYFPALCILGMEITGRSWVGLVSSTFMYSFPVGYVTCAIVAYYVENWRHLHYAITFLSVALLTLLWILPESPRWLWINKKTVQLMRLLEEASSMNRNPCIKHSIIHAVKTSGPMAIPARELKVHMSDLFNTRTIRKQTLISIPLFFFTFVAYYGVLLRLNYMYAEDVFRANLFTGIVEFTATSICLSISARSWLNDSLVLFFSGNFAGTLFLFVNALPDNSPGIPYCILGARFFMSMMNANLMTYIAQLYPTKMRGLGIGFANSFSFLSLLFTANVFNLEKLRVGLATFFMGLSGIISAFLILLLPMPPENNEFLDTINQAEDPFSFEQTNRIRHTFNRL